MNLMRWRRRATSDFADAIRPELQALPTPEPTRRLRERILRARESGSRIILPEVPVRTRRRPAPLFVFSLAAAAIFLLLLPDGARRTGASDPTAIASPGFFGHLAYAQEPKGHAAPALPPIRANAGAMHPIALEFSRRVRDRSGALISDLRSEVALSSDVADGVPAWKLTSLDRDATTNQLHTDVETLYVARSDLRLLRRSVHVAPYSRYQRINVQQRFAGDSIIGRMTTDGPSIGSGRPIARKLPRAFGPYLSDAFAPVFLMAVRLQPGWQGSASSLGWAVLPRDLFMPIELRVEAEETIQVPAGRFVCWRVSLRFSGKELSYWVRKSDGLGIRVLDDSEKAANGIREVVLVRER